MSDQELQNSNLNYFNLVKNILTFDFDEIYRVYISEDLTSIAILNLLVIAILNAFLTLSVYVQRNSVVYLNYSSFTQVQVLFSNTSNFNFAIALLLNAFLYNLFFPLLMTVLSTYMAKFYKRPLLLINTIRVVGFIFLIQIIPTMVSFFEEFLNFSSILVLIINVLLAMWLFATFVKIFQMLSFLPLITSIIITIVAIIISTLLYSLFSQIFLLLLKQVLLGI